jgi:hypothetical protein
LTAAAAIAVFIMQVRSKQYQRDELLQQLLAVTDSPSSQHNQQHSCGHQQQLLLAANVAALCRSLARVTRQVEQVEQDYVRQSSSTFVLLARPQEYASSLKR